MLGLNLGSGYGGPLIDRCAGQWVNVDRHDHWPQVHVVANAYLGLPFPDDYFDRVYLGHFCEHLYYDDQLPRALAEVARVCRPGALIAVVGPCIDKAQAMGMDPAWIATLRPAPGVPDDGHGHKWSPTTEATLKAIKVISADAHEVSIEFVQPSQWPVCDSQSRWQVAILGRVGDVPQVQYVRVRLARPA